MQIDLNGSTLYLAGDFDVRSTSEVRDAIDFGFATGDSSVLVVDLTEVEAVDLTALRLLAFATRRAARDGRHLRLRGCGPSVRRMLHISRLVRLVEVDREEIAA